MSIKSYLSNTYHQFPLPINVREFQAITHGPKVLINSFPKGGTHLLTRVISSIPSLVPRWEYHIPTFIFCPSQHSSEIEKIRKGQYLSAHFFWTSELANTLASNNIKTLFITRDLKDIVVSRAYYLTYKLRNEKTDPFHFYLNSLKDDSERIMACISGMKRDEIKAFSISELASRYVPWLNEPHCFSLRFEDLVGTHGGGDRQKQRQIVRMIVRYLNLDLPEKEIEKIAENAFFQNAATFRKGQIGDWKNHFTDKHKQLFKEVAGDLLIQFGYESEFDW
jgi:sulfotransferase 6B1